MCVLSIMSSTVRSCCALNYTARDVKEARDVGTQLYGIPHNESKQKLWLNTINRKDFSNQALLK